MPYSLSNALKAGWIRGDQIGKALTTCEDELSFNKRNLGKLNSIKIDQIPKYGICRIYSKYSKYGIYRIYLRILLEREEANMLIFTNRSNKLQTELAQSRWG